MAELRFTPKFGEDLSNIAEFIQQDFLILAKEFVTRVFSRLEQLKENPEIGRIVPETNHPKISEIFHGNYRIVYRLKDNFVELLMIRHGSRLR
jgi:toxin ParE1/3/4